MIFHREKQSNTLENLKKPIDFAFPLG